MHVCVSLWAWWEVMAAHHRVHDHACCHLQADCLESGISSGPLSSTMSMGTFTFTFTFTRLNPHLNIQAQTSGSICGQMPTIQNHVSMHLLHASRTDPAPPSKRYGLDSPLRVFAARQGNISHIRGVGLKHLHLKILN